MPDINPNACSTGVNDIIAFHTNHPEGYGIDLHAERESFVKHIADAFRTLVDDGEVSPNRDTYITIRQNGHEWRAGIDYTHASPNACKVQLIT
jgi:hypothetical protein